MCDPGTLLIASTAAAAIGSGVGALQSAAASRYQARVADRNAQLAAEAGATIDRNTKLEAQQRYRQQGQYAGQQVAAMAANGLDLGFGSALDVQRDTAMIGAEDIGRLYEGGFERRRGNDIEGSNYRSQAQGERQAATGALVKGAFDFGSTVLGGATQYSKFQWDAKNNPSRNPFG